MKDKKASNVRLISVPIELDKPRMLRFDMNAFAYLEEEFGGINEAMVALQSGKVKAVLEVMKAGLIHEDETVTVKQIGANMGMSDLGEISNKIKEAMGLALPEPEKDVPGKNEETHLTK